MGFDGQWSLSLSLIFSSTLPIFSLPVISPVPLDVTLSNSPARLVRWTSERTAKLFSRFFLFLVANFPTDERVLRPFQSKRIRTRPINEVFCICRDSLMAMLSSFSLSLRWLCATLNLTLQLFLFVIQLVFFPIWKNRKKKRTSSKTNISPSKMDATE